MAGATMPVTDSPRPLLDRDQIRRALTRIAHEILEKNGGPRELMLVGIVARGPVLANRLAVLIDEFEGWRVPVGQLDVTYHRDDLTLRRPAVTAASEIPESVDQRVVVLVDDVLFTGRTIRAALDELIGYGRPRAVQLATLIDRGHRELPIRADYVGKNVPTAPGEEIRVRLTEVDGDEGVDLVNVGAGSAVDAGSERPR